MNTDTDVAVPPGASEIADLLAWARRLSDPAMAADPGERAAFLTAKAELFARLAATADHGREGSR